MIKKIQIKNFKAIRAASVRIMDLTVFVGNNGSGKSSIIEALQTLQNILLYGLSKGFNERWFGLEHIRNVSSTTSRNNGKIFENDIEIRIQGKIGKEKYCYDIHFNVTANKDLYLITSESLKKNKEIVFKAEIVDEKGNAELFLEKNPQPTNYVANRLVLAEKNLHDNHEFVIQMANYIASWQFLTLEPERMYFPTQRDYGQQKVRMKCSGENIADFFRRLQDDSFKNDLILDKMRYVLLELDNIGSEEITIQKQIYLFLQEQHNDKRIPSWLFSSGTLRILAMLAILNSTEVPPVIFIEEIENGLDPRTLNLLVEEIRGVIPAHQVIATTHSPYFLDLLALKHIVVTERNKGKTIFYHPDDDERLNEWKKKFSAGNLYSMNRLSRS
jgi:predicted ATPase